MLSHTKRLSRFSQYSIGGFYQGLVNQFKQLNQWSTDVLCKYVRKYENISLLIILKTPSLTGAQVDHSVIESKNIYSYVKS